MLVIHCTFGYHRFGTSKLDTFANGVANGIYTNNTSFPSPLIAQNDFMTALQTFNATAADYNMYGATKKTAFANARKKLIDVLDLLADYVDGVVN